MGRPSSNHFNARGVWTEGWYALVRSEEVRRGRVIQRDRLGFRLAVYRGEDGQARVLDARCPHMGASLGEGRVLGNELRCPFHHWTYDGSGVCTRVPYREQVPPSARTRSFRVDERWGLIFVYLGEGEPQFSLPDLPADSNAVRFRKGLVPSHPHVMVPTAVDRWHWQCVHGIEVESMSEAQIVGPFEIRNELSGQLTSAPTTWAQRIFRALGHRRFEWSWSAYGSNLFVVNLVQPMRMDVLITYLPLGDSSEAETVFAFPRRSALARWLGLAWLRERYYMLLLALLFYDDLKIVRSMRFWPRLTAEDGMVGRWIAHVRKMPLGPSPERHSTDARLPRAGGEDQDDAA